MKTIPLFFLCALLTAPFFVGAQQTSRSYSSSEKYTYSPGQDLTTEYRINNLSYLLGDEPVHSGVRTTHDGRKLYFFTDHPEGLQMARNQEIKVAVPGRDNLWEPVGHLEELNNASHNGVHTVLEGGQKLLLLSEYLKNGVSLDGLSISEFDSETGKWSFPEPLKIKGFQNEASTSYFMSPQHDALLLALKNESSYGEQDMYVSFPKGKNKWTKPVNMGPVVNTKGSDGTMFLSPDGKTLYFSSNGRSDSFGGFDIYKSTRLDDSWTKWSPPENLGKPFNSEWNDIYYWIDNATEKSYLSRSFVDENGKHHSDIIAIEKKEYAPSLLVNVYSKLTKEPLSDAVINLETPRGDVALMNGVEFIAQGVDCDDLLFLTADHVKYGHAETEVAFECEESLITSVDLYLMPDKEEATWELKDVLFEFDTDILLPRSIPILKNVKFVLKEQENLVVEISAHTDSRGNDEYNQVLSQKRADAIIRFLVEGGVAPERLRAVGHGENRIRNHCANGVECSEEDHLANRRVEFKILSQGK